MKIGTEVIVGGDDLGVVVAPENSTSEGVWVQLEGRGYASCYSPDNVREIQTDTAPCPFCGGHAEIRRGLVWEAYSKTPTLRGVCCDCGAEGEPVHLRGTTPVRVIIDMAVGKWNSRAEPKPKMKLVHGHEVPDIALTGVCDPQSPVWVATPLAESGAVRRFTPVELALKWGLAYPDTPEGEDAACLHGKILRGEIL